MSELLLGELALSNPTSLDLLGKTLLQCPYRVGGRSSEM
jgi:hypothetical protein